MTSHIAYKAPRLLHLLCLCCNF